MGRSLCRDPQLYKENKEQSFYKNKKDPIKIFKKYLLDNNLSKEKELDNIKLEIEQQLKEAIDFANNSPFPEKEDIFKDVYTYE